MDDSALQHDRARELVAYYDRLAGVYGEGEVFAARRAAVLAAIAEELDAARSVLDLGCGNGTYAAAIIDRASAAQVIGADLSAAMLHAARVRIGESVRLVQANATALPFPAACFDVVFMSHVLQLVDDIEGCVAGVARCLASGGRWITTVGVSGWRESVQQMLGAEAVQELAALVASARSRPATDDAARVAAACEQSGLRPTWRSAPFSATWAAVEEWVRIRWLTIADEAARTQAEHWLEQIRPRAAAHTVTVSETLLVAQKM